MTDYPDIILRCNHGITDGPKDFVQQYEWKGAQSVWLPKDRTTTNITYVGVGMDGKDFQPGTEHHDTQCKHCRTGKLSARYSTLFWAFTLMASKGETEATLTEMQTLLRNMPRGLKVRR